jgi:hypothetical protein
MTPIAASCAVLLALLLPAADAAAQNMFGSSDERIANEGTIGDKWMLDDGVKLATPEYPAAFADEGADVCVAIGYRIRPDGTTGDMAVLKQWNSEKGEAEPQAGFWQAFAESGASALGQWRFKPRPEVGSPRPTYTVATMSFKGSKGSSDPNFSSHCRITDLAAVVQQRKSDAYSRRSREKHDLERANQTGLSRGAMNEQPGRRP